MKRVILWTAILAVSLWIQSFALAMTADIYSAPNGNATGTYVVEQRSLDRSYHGYYTPERQRLIDEIVTKLLARGRTTNAPKVIFMAGAGGSGKSSVRDLLAAHDAFDLSEFVIIDPDEIKSLLPEYVEAARQGNPEAAALVHRESTYIADLLFEAALRRGKSVIFDTTLSHTESAAAALSHVRSDYPRYKKTLIYVYSSLETALARNEQRFAATGRRVPPERIEKAFEAIPGSVRSLDGMFDTVAYVPNDRYPTVTYVRNGRGVHHLDVRLDNLAPEVKVPLWTDPGKDTSAPFDVVFDFDWTLGAEIKKEEFVPNDPDYIEAAGRYFRLSDGTREAIRSLLKHPNVRVSVSSGGERDRIEHILRQIDLGNGLTLFEACYQILTNHDLVTVPGANPNADFSERFKKDLRLVSGDDLNRTAIVEDIQHFVLPGQERNVLYLQKTYLFAESFAVHLRHTPSKYIPPDENAFTLERNKIAWALGILTEAIDKAERGEMVFADAVASLQRDELGHLRNREAPLSTKFYRRGLSEMLRVNPKMRHVPLGSPVRRCESVFEAVL